MELTNELKEKFYSLYWGQYVYYRQFSDYSWSDCLISNKKENWYRGCLLLRPLSSITEEDLNVCWELSCKYDTIIERENYRLDSFRLYPLPVYDYLRSKGYALWFMGIPVSQWVEWGVVKLRE